MKRILVAIGILCGMAALAGDPPATMRVDYFHTGGVGIEAFSLDRVVLEPGPWPGNPSRPIDDTNSGKYLFEVRDRATNRLLYSRGFSSIYGEWETTSEAATVHRTFHESLRFPAPVGPVQIAIRKRDPRTNAFVEAWSALVDPADPFVDRSDPPDAGPLIAFRESGPPAEKTDLLLIGDGYTAGERERFESQARDLLETLFATEPFASRRDDFNVWGLCPPSAEAGVSRPSTGVHRRTPVGATYDAFGSERYVLTFDNRSLRDVASRAPYDLLAILVNGETYGGGGIFNLYTTVAAGSEWARYVFVHELGHSIAGLADEYFTSDIAYEAAKGRPEPWEPNVTALADPTRPKWADRVTAGAPVPTPWDLDGWIAWQAEVQGRRRKIRAANRPESEMNALFREEKEHATKFLSGQEHAEVVGAFEGANYEARGYYRPEIDCIMFTRDDVPFCAVCRQALARILDLYSKR